MENILTLQSSHKSKSKKSKKEKKKHKKSKKKKKHLSSDSDSVSKIRDLSFYYCFYLKNDCYLTKCVLSAFSHKASCKVSGIVP